MFGIVLGVLAERYRRLGPAIAAHMVFNLTAVVSLLVSGS
jgi:membrane protease YdiL (CAAX protease family)